MGHHDPTMPWRLADIPDLSGRIAVVTGANGGLGLETARILARRRAHVVMAVRDPGRGETARDSVLRTVPSGSLELVALDLASLESVRTAAAALAIAHPRIDILVNNAGIMATPWRTSPDGHELQLAVNHLGHFALTAALLSSLARSTAGRIVSLTSTGRFRARPLDLDDPRMERGYDAWLAYGRSKLAALQFAVELHARLSSAGLPVRSVAADPGFARTDLQARSVREVPALGQRFFAAFVDRFGSSPQRGAMPQLRAATDPTAPGGALYALRLVLRGDPVRVPVIARHMGAGDRARMWHASETLTGVRFDLPDPKPAER